MKEIVVTEALAMTGVKVMIRDTSRYKHQAIDKTGNKMIGTISGPSSTKGWTKVQWSDGHHNSYSVGAQELDLQLYFPEGVIKEVPVSNPAPTVQEMRDALSESIKYVKEEEPHYVDPYYEKRGYDIYGKSLKPDKYGTTSTGQHGPFKVRRAISTIEGPKRRS